MRLVSYNMMWFTLSLVCNLPLSFQDCPMLSAVQYGTIDLSAGYWENSIATYYCQKDHAMVGTATRICESTGRWSGTEPVCLYGLFLSYLLSLFILGVN